MSWQGQPPGQNYYGQNVPPSGYGQSPAYGQPAGYMPPPGGVGGGFNQGPPPQPGYAGGPPPGAPPPGAPPQGMGPPAFRGPPPNQPLPHGAPPQPNAMPPHGAPPHGVPPQAYASPPHAGPPPMGGAAPPPRPPPGAMAPPHSAAPAHPGAPPPPANYQAPPPTSTYSGPGGYGTPPVGGYVPPQAQPGGYAPRPQTPVYGGAPPPHSSTYGTPTSPQAAQPYGSPPQQPGYGSPPAGNYGNYQAYTAPPGGYAPQQPPQQPPPGVSPDVWQWFISVDQDRSGKITAHELQRALVNGNWTPFNPETCRLMVNMFDKTGDGTINIHEFQALSKYIQDWKRTFDGFDLDRSGTINQMELQNAFRQFGYNLSPTFCSTVIRVFDRTHRNVINFDDFIQCCVMLKSLTDSFRSKDVQQQGIVNISYEDFLRMALDNVIVGGK